MATRSSCGSGTAAIAVNVTPNPSLELKGEGMTERTDSGLAGAPAITRAAVYGLWLGLALQTAFGLMLSIVLLPRGAIGVATAALAVLIGIEAFFTVMISRGENWARIVYAVFYGLPSLLTFPIGGSGRGGTLPVLGYHLPLAVPHAIFGGIILCSIVVLFLPASNAWFRERTRARGGSGRRRRSWARSSRAARA